MEKINLEATKSLPQIILDATENILLIKGQSYPENSAAFYSPILKWMLEYLENLEGEGILKIHLTYLNTSSSKSIMDIIEIFNNAFNEGKNVKIHWYYSAENEALLECGEEFKEDEDLPFELIEIEEN